MRRQLGVAQRVRDVLVAEIGLQGPRIVPGIGQGEAASVPQRVWVGLAASPARSTSPLKAALVNGAPTRTETWAPARAVAGARRAIRRPGWDGCWVSPA